MIYRFYHKIQSVFVLLLTVLLASSCTQEEEVSAAVGYLHFPSFEVDLTVEDLVETRAVDLYNVPEASEVTYVVKDKDGKEVYNKQGVWTSPIVMPVGEYTIEATYGSNGFGAPYFRGTATGTIAPLAQEKPSLEMTLSNAMIRVSVGTTLVDHFEPGSTVSLKASGMTGEAAYNTWYYIPSGPNVVLTLNGSNSAGNPATFSYTLTAPQAGKAYNVVCEKDESNWPAINLPEQQDGAWNTRLYITPATYTNVSTTNGAELVYEVSASSTDWTNPIAVEQISGDYYVAKGLTNGSTYYVRARIGNVVSEVKSFTVNENLPGASVTNTHYNTGSLLAGTNSNLTLGLTGILETLRSKGLLQVDATLSNASSTEVRTATVDGNMNPASGWPYLPQGTDYKLTVNHKLSTESTALVSVKSGISVSAPTFTVTMGGYSSYDKYVAGDINGANSVPNAETIYDAGASWGISSSLMSNSNYTKSMKMFLGDTEKASQTPTTNSYTLGEIANLTTWQAYTVKAVVTFDGVTVEATKTHHITGLPYTAAPPKDSGNNPWTRNGNSAQSTVSFESEGVTFSGISQSPSMTSPMFHVPADINVAVASSIKKTGLISTNYQVAIGGTNVISQKCSATTYSLNGNGTLTSANNNVTCKSTYTVVGPKVIVYSVSLSYR